MRRNWRRGAIEAGMPVWSIWAIVPAIIAMVTVIAVVTTPVVITSASAAASTPAVCIGTYTDLEVKITSHIAEHIAPHIIEEIKVIIPAIITVPAVTTVIVPRHVKCDSG
jgi:hypothetical protein